MCKKHKANKKNTKQSVAKGSVKLSIRNEKGKKRSNTKKILVLNTDILNEKIVTIMIDKILNKTNTSLK